MTRASAVSVGLGGDGDEIAAIDDVERAFAVKLDHADAPLWSTAGAVFDSLRKALPADELDSPEIWQRFSEALCGVTGVDPMTIERESPLLSDSRIWARLADASGVVWTVSFAVIVLALAVAALINR